MSRRLVGLVLSAPMLFGCELWDAPLSDPDCSATPIDAKAELLIAEPWLRHDARAKNADGGVFSFAGQLAALRDRYSAFDAHALWGLIGSDESTPPAQLPFRLLALVNRTDLAEQFAPESPAGEARLVYTLTNGPGDDPASSALPLTVIFEYSLASARSARDWSATFHGLSGVSTGPMRVQATHDLVASFVSPPPLAGAPYLAQLRVNDGRSGTPELYELALDAAGALQRRGLRNTPRPELAGTPELLTFARDHERDIANGSHHLPSLWLANSAPVEHIQWLAGLPQLDHDFTLATCPGCHGQEGPGAEGFHLSEAPDGSIRLSPFLIDEDLPRRARVMRARLCGD